jgi:uncharacterized membrane protein
MKDLIVVTYDNHYSAQEALNELRRLNYRWLAVIADAVAVARDAKGDLHVQDSYELTSKASAGFGVVWGMILGSVVLAPLTGGLSTAAAVGLAAAGAAGGAALGSLAGASVAHAYKADFGLPEEFVSKVSVQIRPGGSAIFALLQSPDPDPGPEYLARYFRDTGGKIIRTTLTPRQRERVQQILNGAA